MKRWWTARTLLTAYVLVIALLLLLLPDRKPSEEAVAAMAESEVASAPAGSSRPWWQQVLRPSLPTARSLLADAIPGLVAGAEAGPATSDLVVYLVTGAQLSRPTGFFETVQPALADIQRGSEEPVAPALAPAASAALPPPEEPLLGPAPPSPPPEPGPAPAPVAAGPLVGIYHTHDWESYVDVVAPGTDPQLMNSNDPNKSVIRVGRELTQALQKLGIGVVHSEASHQKDGYLGAYSLSRATAQNLLATHPTIKVLIDLHRDALARQFYVANVGGQTAAKLDLVIGQGDPSLPQPHWPENNAYAHQLCDAVNARYAGLCRGVLVKQQDRYNQDLLPGAVLIEVGTSYSQMGEALRTVDLLAPVLADLLNQGKYPH